MKDAIPLPRTEDVLEALGGAQWFLAYYRLRFNLWKGSGGELCECVGLVCQTAYTREETLSPWCLKRCAIC